jgi:hypothetical protein
LGCAYAGLSPACNYWGVVMNTQDSCPRLSCHRCKKPMALQSEEVVKGDAMRIFHCEHCNTLAAVKVEKAA